MQAAVRSSGAKQRVQSSSRYLPHIDGLRGIAVSAVVFFHCGLVRSGFVGVDIFFVISGFLIGGIVYRDVQGGSFSFTTFYARRARRLLPGLLVVTGFTLLVGTLVMSPAELSHLAISAASAVGAVSNFRFLKGADYFSPDAGLDPMLMTWSLGVEEQFYVVFPLLLLLLRRLQPQAIIAALTGLTVASLMLSVAMTVRAPTAAFYMLPTRAWEFGLGVLLAVWNSQGRPRLSNRLALPVSLVSLAAVGASLFIYSRATPFPGLAALLPGLGAVGLIASESSPINRRLLSHAAPVWIGRISYSWYLWHWPLMALCAVCSVEALPQKACAIIAFVSLGLAAASWALIERPLRRAFKPGPVVLRRYGVVLAACSLGALAFSIGVKVLWRPPEALRSAQDALVAQRNYPCLASWGARAPSTSGVCAAERRGLPIIALLGDSHAAALGPELHDLAEAAGWGSLILTKSSCRPFSGVTVWRADQPSLADDCAAFNDTALRRTISDPSVRTVVLAGLWAGPLENEMREHYVDLVTSLKGVGLLQRGLEVEIALLERAGKRVVIAEDGPLWTFDPAPTLMLHRSVVRRFVAHLIDSDLIDQVQRGEGPTFSIEPTAYEAVAKAANRERAPIIDLHAALCSPRCHFTDGASLLFADQSHVTRAGAELALRPYVAVLFQPKVSASLDRATP